MTRVVAIAANSSWNILHFRLNLIRAIAAKGYDPVILSPDGGRPQSGAPASEFAWEAVQIDRAG